MIKNLVDILAFNIIRSVLALIRFLPYPVALRIARFCVIVLRIVMPRITSVARTNLKLAFGELSQSEHQKILNESFEVMARHILNFARIPDFTPKQSKELFDLREYANALREIRNENPKSGILVATMHYGCFELLAQAIAHNLKPISCLIREFGLPRLDAWWSKRRTMYGSELFSRNGGYKELVNRLKNQETVAVLYDQNVKSNHAIFVPFFGIEVATTKALALASIRTGSPIVFLVSVDLGRNKFELIFKRLTSPIKLEGSLEEKIKALTEELNQAAELAIRKHPEQWFWIHRRFKTRPPGDNRKFYS